MVIHWPKGYQGAAAKCAHQYHHCTDIVPTILECCGLTMPDVVDGVKQAPLAGVSMRYTFDDAKAPTRKETQYYEMLGTRGIWHKGWKAATEHGPMIDNGKFDQDRWQLFHTDVDRAEAHDLADENPDKVKELAALWLAEAEKNNVLPLNDYGVAGIHALEYKVAPPAERPLRLLSRHDARFPRHRQRARSACRSRFSPRSSSPTTSQGVIVSQGSRFGGYTLFVKDGKLAFVYNFLGIPPEQQLSCPAPPPGNTHRRRRVRQVVSDRQARNLGHDDPAR